MPSKEMAFHLLLSHSDQNERAIAQLLDQVLTR